MKKLLCFILAFCMLFLLCACKENRVTTSKKLKPTKSQTVKIPFNDEGPTKVNVTRKYKYLNPFTMPFFNYGTYYDCQTGVEMPYRYAMPSKTVEGKEYPVILYFHGNGAIGTDNISQLGGITEAYSVAGDIMSEAIVILPQTATGWDTSFGSGGLDIAIRLAESFAIEHDGDINRIYATGISLGGFATWDALAEYPDFFAAAVPICGGVYTSNIFSYLNTPIWTYHGNADTVVPFESTRQTYDYIVSSGGEKIKFIELDGVDHNAWNYAYTDREMLSWLFSQELGGKQDLDYTYRSYFSIVSTKGRVLVTDKDITFSYIGPDGIMSIQLADSAVKRLQKCYKENPDEVFILKIGSKRLYDFTIQSFSKENFFKIEQTLDQNNYNVLCSMINSNRSKALERDQIYIVHGK